MKKMSMSTLARGNLKGRRKQYLTLFFGVFFAMLFSMSALFFVSSFRASVRAKNERSYGKAEIILTNATGEDWSKLNRFFKDPAYGFAHLIGACNTEFYDESGERIVLSVGWLDDKAKELSNAELMEGAYPEKEGEIAIEESALLHLDLADAKIGDQIELPVRVQNGSGYLPDEVTQTYTLTGILYDKSRNIAHIRHGAQSGLPALQVAANTAVAPGGKENLSAYLHYKEQLFSDNGAFFQYIGSGDNLIPVFYEFNADSDGANDLAALYVVISIFAVSLLLVSCVGIVNAFRSRLDDRKTVLDEVWDKFRRLEQYEVRGALGQFLFTGDEVFSPVSTLSGGEKGRVALTELMLRKDNVLLLDEPTNHLDMDSREVLEEALEDFEGTIIAISHDRYFINRFAQKVCVLEDGRLKEYLGNYDDYFLKISRDQEPDGDLPQRTRTAAEKEKRKSSQQN